jgi:hypothetical protein
VTYYINKHTKVVWKYFEPEIVDDKGVNKFPHYYNVERKEWIINPRFVDFEHPNYREATEEEIFTETL